MKCGPTARRFAPGDRVFGIVGGGGLAERVVVHERHVTAVPSSLDDLGAAAVPEVFITAHDAIRSQADPRMGELLRVNGGKGGVGSAALQIGAAAAPECSQRCGLRPFVTRWGRSARP